MALLAFQGAGYTPQGSKNDPFTRVVCAVGVACSAVSNRTAVFSRICSTRVTSSTRRRLCTIAICELYGMTRDETYRDPAQKAVDYCVKIQAAEGGWRYQPGIDSDMSVTGWFAMALQSAGMAGIEVPSSAFEGIGKYLDLVAREEGSRYAYRPRDGATLPLTAEGLLCRQYLGWERDDPRSAPASTICSRTFRSGTNATSIIGTTARRCVTIWKAPIGRSGTA